ncbi:MAG: hypothetical protein KC501_37680 [Myxococcales bacterium]|nr:hypothetical protein [Myxococcales bacterium]
MRGALAVALSLVGIEIPAELELRPGPEAVRDGTSDLLPDGTLVAHWSDGEAEEAFVLDVQLRKDPSKPTNWVVYVSITRRRLRCPTSLVVVTPFEGVESWAAGPIEIGRGHSLVPIVIGPSSIPHDVSLERAREIPMLATLAVVAHGRGPHAEQVGRVAIDTIRAMVAGEDQEAGYHADVVYAFLDEDVRRTLEEEMNVRVEGPPYSSYLRQLEAQGHMKGLAEGRMAGREEGLAEGREEGLAEGLAEGRMEGRAQMLLALAARRGLRMTARQRSRVRSCADEALLMRWFDRTITATSATEIFSRSQ